MKKKVDGRLRSLIESNVRRNHRTLMVVVGDNARSQVVTLHYLLSKASVRARPSVLWCYKTQLALSSHRRKRMKQIKKMVQRGVMQPGSSEGRGAPGTDDPFALFVASTSIRYGLRPPHPPPRPAGGDAAASACRGRRRGTVRADLLFRSGARSGRAPPPPVRTARLTAAPARARGARRSRYCYYHESHKVLGNTYGMCVLQDFEALTPNLLARTVETVEGGGLIVLMLDKMSSLRQLYSMAMDAHARFRTESHQEVTCRFNERFILSLGANASCCVMDDELNILPLSSHIRSIPESAGKGADAPGAGADAELRELRESLRGTEPAGSLIRIARTVDQAKALLTFLDAASEKSLRSTVALTASRGRGKSAAMGIAIAGALALGYANIFVTAPSPENLKTLFEFVFKGLDALDYKEHLDYSLVESTNPAMNKCVVRVNVFRAHRQTVQFVLPHHVERMSQVRPRASAPHAQPMGCPLTTEGGVFSGGGVCAGARAVPEMIVDTKEH